MTLPPPLRRFAPVLALFPEEVALGLGPLLGRLALLLGSSHAGPGGGDGEPDGYDGLSRRGSYERLLPSEWLLAEELPDEFLRRAAMGELAFFALARRRPVASRRTVVLFDAGPDQLGGPRLLHLAALVLLADRARAHGASFAFGALQAKGILAQPASAGGLTAAGVTALLEARRRRPPDGDDVARWWQEIGPRGGTDAPEIWLVGGPDLPLLAAGRPASLLLVEEPLEPGAACLRVTARPLRQAPRGALLELPPPPDRVRLLRSPFVGPPPVPRGQTLMPARGTNLVFGRGGRHVLYRTADDRLVCQRLPNSPRATVPRPVLFRPPPGQRVLGAGSDGTRLFVVTREGQALVLHRLGKRGGAAGQRPPRYLSLTHPDLMSPMEGWDTAPDLLPCIVVHGGARLYLLGRDGTFLHLHPEGGWFMHTPSVLAAMLTDGDQLLLARCVSGPAMRERVCVEFQDPLERTPPRPVQVLETDRLLLVHVGGHLTPLVALSRGGVFWRLMEPILAAPPGGEGGTHLERGQLSVPEDQRVCGVLWGLDDTRWSAQLISLDQARRVLSIHRPDEPPRTLLTSPDPIAWAGVSPGAPLLGCVTVKGEVLIYSTLHDQLLLRLGPEGPS